MIDKALALRHGAAERVRRERALLDRLRGAPSVTRLLFTFQDARAVYLALEHVPGGELYDQVRLRGRLPAADARFYAAEVVLALGELRAARVVHRDLKPENLLLDAGGHLKLIDFGSAAELAEEAVVPRPRAAAAEEHEEEAEAREQPPPAQEEEDERGDGAAAASTAAAAAASPPPAAGPRLPFAPPRAAAARTTSLVGTADYVSPEVLRNEPLSCAADLWALGCVLHQLLAGRPPFQAASEYLTFQAAVAGEAAPLPADAPPAAAALVAALLAPDPAARPGAADLAELRAHPFFEGVDWAGLRAGPAPTPAPRGASSNDGSGASSFDWELASLAAALPGAEAEAGPGAGGA